ncbi:galactokinase [Spongiivirga citrea]|uniref:Galactokinase n=1 Tax=Spongiivirga citrea TaxID=1481457 RepID=A0A6M0CEQ1_9FLAO|nr:galactokinase [Spongiivirga citrea]NER15902.1 galactokinase [Spongiivirga citrea]
MKPADLKGNVKKDQTAFIEAFSPELVVHSPGRINFIGGHTDYNNGLVLPTAINQKIHLYFRKNSSNNQCSVTSIGFDEVLKIDLHSVKKSNKQWENYILGVVQGLQKRNNAITGFDCIIDSQLPIGSGISSSAALECGMAYGLNQLFDLGISTLDMIKLSRDAEHEFVGTKCGIMDQFAVMISKKEHVVLLDCESVSYSLIPMNLKPYKLLLLNTNVSHNLATSEYNTRRSECEAAVEFIQKYYPEVNSLRNAENHMIYDLKNKMDETLYKRSHFIVNENARVQKAADALRTEDLNTFGDMLYQSHHGLSTLYEVSCPELDFLVEFSKNNEHILGSRMMGGGFGGCTINIIHEDAIEDYINKVSMAYEQEFSLNLSPIVVEPDGGTTHKTNQ